MTFTVRVRPADAPTAAFLCPTHGHFTLRSRADTAPCPECGADSPWSLDAPPASKTQWVTAASMGKSEPRPHEGIMDTRSLAEGQRYGAWKKERAKYWRDVDHRQFKKIREGG